MAVIYSVGKIAKPRDPFYQVGKKYVHVRNRLQVNVATAAAGDIYVLAESLSGASRVDSIITRNTSGTLTAATNNDLGFYVKQSDGTLKEPVVNSGKAISAAQDYSAGSTAGTDLMAGMSDANSTKTINELLGLNVDQEPIGGYVLGLRMNTAPTTNNRTLDIATALEEATTR